MINDPAWFYSSLAQVSAAIFGLLGAILGSRIIDQFSKAHADHEEIKNEMFELSKYIMDRKGALLDYSEYLINFREANLKAFERGEKKRIITYSRSWLSEKKDFSQEIDIETTSEEAKKEMNEIKKIEDTYVLLRSVGDISIFLDRLDKLEIKSVENRQQVTIDKVKARILRNRVNSFLKNLLPPSFIVIFIIMLVFSVPGIIWPLSLLPGIDKSVSKSVMVISLCLGIASISGYFIFQIFNILRLKNIKPFGDK